MSKKGKFYDFWGAGSPERKVCVFISDYLRNLDKFIWNRIEIIQKGPRKSGLKKS